VKAKKKDVEVHDVVVEDISTEMRAAFRSCQYRRRLSEHQRHQHRMKKNSDAKGELLVHLLRADSAQPRGLGEEAVSGKAHNLL
jgi:hypothetical protein